MLDLLQTNPRLGLIAIISLLMSLVLHELGHSYAATWMGDPTPRQQGRLSLNPAKHLDLAGVGLILYLGFGYAKPVQTQPELYRYSFASFFISSAGVVVNFIIALVCLYSIKYFPMNELLGISLAVTAKINIMLGVFNILPIPPLDGSHMLTSLLPKKLETKINTYLSGSIAWVFLFILLGVNYFFDHPLGKLFNNVFDATKNFVLN